MSRTMRVARHSLSTPAWSQASTVGRCRSRVNASVRCWLPRCGDSCRANATCAAIPFANTGRLRERPPSPGFWSAGSGSSREARRALSRACLHPSKSLSSAQAFACSRHPAAICSCEAMNPTVTRACAAATADLTRSNAES